MRTPGTAAELERRRLLAVRRVEQGYSQAEVARFLGVHPRTVQRWVRAFRRFGAGGLAPFDHPGRCPKLLPSHEEIVLRWLTESPRRHGFHTELWTAPRIAQLIKSKWGIDFHPRYLNEWLRRHRISPQKPLLQPRERNQDAIDRWLADDWPRLLERARATGAHLVFIDESGLLMRPLVRRTQAPRGQPPVLPHRAKHRDKVSLLAALTLSPVRGHLGLYFRTYPQEYINNVAAALFLEDLLRQLRGAVIVVWDGGTMHKGEPIRQLLKRYPRLSLERLPPYAPDVNPVEQLWSYVKYGRLPNYAPASVPELDGEVGAVLAETRQDRRLLKAFWDHSELPPLEGTRALNT